MPREIIQHQQRVSLTELRVELDAGVTVLDAQVEGGQLVVARGTVTVRLGVVRIKPDGLRVSLQRFLVFACGQRRSMTGHGSRLDSYQTRGFRKPHTTMDTKACQVPIWNDKDSIQDPGTMYAQLYMSVHIPESAPLHSHSTPHSTLHLIQTSSLTSFLQSVT